MTDRNGGLDGIRGIAILAVLFFHATMTLGHHWPPVVAMLRVTQAGWLGVEIFFALSGFLITSILVRRRSQRVGAYLAEFYRRRALRILPLYFFVLALLLALPVVVTALRGPEYDRFLSMQGWFWLHGANIARAYHADSPQVLEFGWFELTHFWSLAVEEHYYLVWPIVVFFLPRRALAIVCLLVLALAIGLRSGHVAWAPVIAATPSAFGGLAIGSLAAIAPALFGRPSLYAALATFASVAALGLVDHDTGWAASAVAAWITAALCVEVTNRPSATISQALSARWLTFFGTYSYGLYVYHVILGPSYRKLDLSAFPGGYSVGAVVYVGIFIALPTVVAVASYRWIESPFLRMKDKTATDHSAAGVQARRA
jgi:peptidoglycan/LPS O-acetylase OafA/YrhL